MAKLKIGFDAKRLFLNKSGLGVYSRALVRALSLVKMDIEFHLYTPEAKKWEETEFFFDQENIFIHESTHKSSGFWRTFKLANELKRDQIDIYHGLSGELPRGLERSTIRTVLTVHDLIYKYFPMHYTFIDRQIYSWKMKHAIQTADHIIAVSKATIGDVERFYPKAVALKERCKVIYEISHHKFYENPKSVETNDAPYFLFVGDTNPRKNLAMTLRAFESIATKNDQVRLKITAPYEHYVNNLIRLNIRKHKDRIDIITDVTTEQMIALYQNAIVLIYPSEYEGFGLPLLEARLLGVPCISTNRKPFTEVIDQSNAVLLDSPIHERELQIAMSQYLNASKVKLKNVQLPDHLLPDNILNEYVGVYEKLS